MPRQLDSQLVHWPPTQPPGRTWAPLCLRPARSGRKKIPIPHSQLAAPSRACAYRSLGRPALGVDEPFLHLAPFGLVGREGQKGKRRARGPHQGERGGEEPPGTPEGAGGSHHAGTTPTTTGEPARTDGGHTAGRTAGTAGRESDDGERTGPPARAGRRGRRGVWGEADCDGRGLRSRAGRNQEAGGGREHVPKPGRGSTQSYCRSPR
jgi:hypothetical protein